MRHIFFVNFVVCVIFAFAFVSCEKESQEHVDMVIVPQEKDNNYLQYFQSQEIFELTRNNQALISRIHEIKYYKDFILIHDRNDILFLFDKNGNFVSNSYKKFGHGKGEYYLCLAASFNEESQNVEIVVPDGILFYDKEFQFIKKSFFDEKYHKHMFNKIYDLGKDQHVMLTPWDKDNIGPALYVYDSNASKMIKAVRYDKSCEHITMQNNCLYTNGFFAPPSMSYSFYRFDSENLILSKFLTLDFGDRSLMPSDWEDRNEHEIRKYLAEGCSKSLPLRTFWDKGKLVSVVKDGIGRVGFNTLIYDSKNRKSIYLSNDNNNKGLPIFDEFKGNTLYACVPVTALDDYVMPELLDSTSLEIYNQRDLNSNYFVIKYQLKQ